MEQYFETVIFAILGKDNKCDDFMEIFGDKMDDCRCEETRTELPKQEFQQTPFIQSAYPFPICNHTSQIDKCNLGYTQGILSDGIPFEAELWESENTKMLSVFLPEIEDFYLKENETVYHSLDVGNMTYFHSESEYRDEGALGVGMILRDVEGEGIDMIKLGDYLEKKGMVVYKEIMRNGSVSLLTDIEGHDLIRMNITLEEKGTGDATTSLKFMNFPNKAKGPKLEIVK